MATTAASTVTMAAGMSARILMLGMMVSLLQLRVTHSFISGFATNGRVQRSARASMSLNSDIARSTITRRRAVSATPQVFQPACNPVGMIQHDHLLHSHHLRRCHHGRCFLGVPQPRPLRLSTFRLYSATTAPPAPAPSTSSAPKFAKQQSLSVFGPTDTSKRPFKLVIVESPSKCSTISKILQKHVKENDLDYDFVVTSCMGHIRDLPKQKTSKDQLIPGIDLEGDRYEAEYITMPGKIRLLEELKDWADKAQQLVLATDDDREGEAMAWHLLECLQNGKSTNTKKKKKNGVGGDQLPAIRIRFTEITAKAIVEAIQNPSDSLRDGLVQAQETRRVLDRLAGFTVSPVLWKKIAPGLSAGRVQSVGMALIVERERQRLRFQPSEYWSLNGTFASLELVHHDKGFDADLVAIDGIKLVSGTADFEPNESNKLTRAGRKKHHLMESEATELTKRIEASPDDWSWQIGEIKSTKRKTQSPTAFITSTIQQEANRRLALSVSQTMQCAQKLYENGYISYMRTDSDHLSNDTVAAVLDCIVTNYGGKANFQPKDPSKAKKSTKKMKRSSTKDDGSEKPKEVDPQAAHEAIRPAIQPDGKFLLPLDLPSKVGPMEVKVYEMIFRRTVASCMPPQISNQTTVTIEGTDGNTDVQFRTTGSVVLDPGYTTVYASNADKERMELPSVTEGQPLQCKSISCTDHVTQPPARYTEASFVRELELLGVGRPSTYANIVKTLRDRAYVGSPIAANQDSIRGTKKQVSGMDIVAQRAAGGDDFTGSAGARGPMVPSLSAFVVCSLLEDHCPMFVDSDFTARMEEQLDHIANTDVAEAERIKYLDNFYKGDSGLAAQIDRIDKEVEPDVARRAQLPSLTGDAANNVGLFIGPWGPYVKKVDDTSQNDDNDGAETASTSQQAVSASLPPGLAADISSITQPMLERILKSKESSGEIVGEHPEDGRPVFIKVGRYGSYLQWGEDGEEKTTTHSLPRSIGSMRNIDASMVSESDQSLSDLIGLTFEEAIKYLELPKTISTLHGKPIVGSIGPYGPYLRYDGTYANLKKNDPDVIWIDAEEAEAIVTERIINSPKTARGVLVEVGEKDGSMVTVKRGRFGSYINWREVNAKLPAEYMEDPSDLPLDTAWALIEKKAANPKTRSAKEGRKTRGVSSSAGADLPKAPKRPLSAYLHFCAARRSEVAKSTSSLGEASKELARQWSKISEADRAAFDGLAQQSKEEYEVKKKQWEEECNQETGAKPKKTTTTKKKKKKKTASKSKSKARSSASSNQPKRPRSAYIFFCGERRPEVAKTLTKLGDISKELGRQWKSISDEDKQKFEEMAAQDKQRYLQECE